MMNWIEADNHIQAHFTTADRINRQAWLRSAGPSGDRFADGASARLTPRSRATFRGAVALCRHAGRVLALPLHRGAQPS